MKLARNVASSIGLVVVAAAALLFVLFAVDPITHCGDMRDTKALADIKGIEEGLYLFKHDKGSYPTTAEGLQALVQTPASASNYNPDGYLDKLPVDPWGSPYRYSSNGQGYHDGFHGDYLVSAAVHNRGDVSDVGPFSRMGEGQDEGDQTAQPTS